MQSSFDRDVFPMREKHTYIKLHSSKHSSDKKQVSFLHMWGLGDCTLNRPAFKKLKDQ